MRQRFIEALTYPRMLMISLMDFNECPMNRYFNPGHESCQICEQGDECHWLNSNDEFSVLAEQPMDALVGAFVFSTDYVDAYISRQNHNPRRCACETCSWLRDAWHLIREYEHWTGKGVAT